jgi:Zn-finger nucleic acid-binding protein
MIERAEGIKVYRGSEHICPDCKTTLLYRHFFSSEGDIEINQCSKCRGFWIDLAGLAKMQTLPTEEKKLAFKKYFTNILDKKLSGMYLQHDDMAQQAKVLTEILQFLCPEGQWTE